MTTLATLVNQPSRAPAALQGDVVVPGQDGFDQARRAFNLAADQHPAAVVLAESADDVVAAVTFAAEHGQQIAAQVTGHNAMPLGALTGTILLKTGRMRSIQIHPAARTARVQAGGEWAEVVEAAAREGLAAVAGSSPNVGVVGCALGGGVSFLGRKYGLSASNARAIEVVTADGQLLRTDSQNEPDLFWALRGGRGSFGVVTAIELQLAADRSGGSVRTARRPVEQRAWEPCTPAALADQIAASIRSGLSPRSRPARIAPRIAIARPAVPLRSVSGDPGTLPHAVKSATLSAVDPVAQSPHGSAPRRRFEPFALGQSMPARISRSRRTRPPLPGSANLRRQQMHIGGIGSIILAVWLIIGTIAGAQRHYYDSSSLNCAKAGTIVVTILAGPLNYIGVNPKISCPTPSK